MAFTCFCKPVFVCVAVWSVISFAPRFDSKVALSCIEKHSLFLELTFIPLDTSSLSSQLCG